MPLVQLTVLVSALLGWSDIDIQPSRGDRAAASYRSVATLDRPTERTVETLRRYNLEREYRRDVNGALLRIEKFAQQRAEPELVYALAELSWIEAKRLDRWRKPQALDRYLDAAAYAYDFLFDDDPVLAEGRKPADPRFRQAMELYNAGRRPPDPRGDDQGTRSSPRAARSSRSSSTAASVDSSSSSQDSPWRPTDVHKLLLATDFEVSGLNLPDSHQYGIGVPLIAVRETRTTRKASAIPRSSSTRSRWPSR